MKISDVAERTGLSVHTIRFYEKSGLFPKVKRSENGIREFVEADIEFLQFMAVLKKTGMSLEDISEFMKEGCILERLESGEMPNVPVENRLSILLRHLENIEAKKRELELVEDSVRRKISYYEKYLTNS
ncbi:MerR family transcriptional regulator [Paenibacillus taihuensis]|uniref:MerR family transcriptional regulator n=1 Tax=Paenibacillus taihuensis TaxID=1156355 RepID=A0A3D9QUE2_9BACL|nr:MerR family transcriptional regulator [Paenibacillus taihuensis]